MSRMIRAAVITLLLAPFLLLLLIAGGLFLWDNLWLMKWLWIPVPICWALAYWVYRLGKKKGPVLWQPQREVSYRWTDRDRTAWEIVEASADDSATIEYEQFFTADLYVDATKRLAEQLARHYHANEDDPIGVVTVMEILTAVELAVVDLRRFVEDYVPGSHLVTIQWLRRASRVPTSWRKLRPIYEAVSLFWNPWGVLYRTASDQTVVQPMMGELEKDAMGAIYQAFVLSVGKYLIELNSRRLKAGPERWRQWMEPERSAPGDIEKSPADREPAEPRPLELRITVVGQVKAGKSSVVNALIGQQQAAVDILPLTKNVKRYQLQQHATSDSLVLLDTVGYARESVKADRLDETMEAVHGSAMTILVINACQPAREPDVAFLREMEKWFTEHPEFRRPPVLAVLTHIDQLPPVLEWEPPYEGWLDASPMRPKEQNIRAVVKDVRELFGPSLAGAVPACSDTDHGRVYGVDQWVVPALVGLLPQAEGKALVDGLHAEMDKGRFGKLMNQLWNTSSLLARYGFCGADAILPESGSPAEQEE